jgi:photosystem II stability/assembly factor-like uncharacterized protein
MNRSLWKSFAVLLAFFFATLAWGQQWTPLGPDGGDVRSLSRDPFMQHRILLSTSAGQLYESLDDGTTWSRFAKLGEGNDYVLDRVVFDPAKQGVVYVAAWSVENTTGDVFRSNDGGKTWKTLKAMHGRSVRGFAMAHSNPDILVAGALDGVYRSEDGGDHWKLISPENHPDIRNLQSVAIDPRDANIIYVGTWHLPWKTADGGKTWANIKNGIIDDSDVFSIIIDPVVPSTLYASACSGIYKSDSSGGSFRKVQGMPFSARRTRVLMQDPVQRNVVYAGTTEGLWKTIDSGATWRRMTGANIIVNDVLVDPTDPARVLLATDRSGVLLSKNGAETFTASNRGFAHRQVATVLMDRDDSSTFYAGLINDKEFGGVFATHDSGVTWNQMNAGLDDRDVFVLRQAPDGELVAGTNGGVMAYREEKGKGQRWVALNNVINVYETTRIAPAVKGKAKARPVLERKIVRSTLTARVNDLQLYSGKWFAATSSGMFMSNDEGRSWHGGPLQGENEFVAVKSNGQVTLAAARRALFLSTDNGNSWSQAAIPGIVASITDVAFDDHNDLFIASREGAYRSDDGGATWEHLKWLPVDHLATIVFDDENHRLITTSNTSPGMYESPDSGRTWKHVQTGFLMHAVRSSRGRVLATTAFDGVVAQPENSGSARVSAGFSGDHPQK